MTDNHFKIFNSLYNSGKIIGSFLFLILYNTMNRKLMMIISIILKSLGLICLGFTNNIYFLFALRLITGCCAIIPLIYSQLWVDQFCLLNTKYAMIAWIMISITFENSFGFILNYYISSSKVIKIYLLYNLFNSGIYLF